MLSLGQPGPVAVELQFARIGLDGREELLDVLLCRLDVRVELLRRRVAGLLLRVQARLQLPDPLVGRLLRFLEPLVGFRDRRLEGRFAVGHLRRVACRLGKRVCFQRVDFRFSARDLPGLALDGEFQLADGVSARCFPGLEILNELSEGVVVLFEATELCSQIGDDLLLTVDGAEQPPERDEVRDASGFQIALVLLPLFVESPSGRRYRSEGGKYLQNADDDLGSCRCDPWSVLNKGLKHLAEEPRERGRGREQCILVNCVAARFGSVEKERGRCCDGEVGQRKQVELFGKICRGWVVYLRRRRGAVVGQTPILYKVL